MKNGCGLLSPAEDRGLQRKTWLRKGCAKTTGEREFPQQQQCPSTRQGSVSHWSSTCARLFRAFNKMLCDHLPAGRISEIVLLLPGHERGAAGGLHKHS